MVAGLPTPRRRPIALPRCSLVFHLPIRVTPTNRSCSVNVCGLVASNPSIISLFPDHGDHARSLARTPRRTRTSPGRRAIFRNGLRKLARYGCQPLAASRHVPTNEPCSSATSRTRDIQRRQRIWQAVAGQKPLASQDPPLVLPAPSSLHLFASSLDLRGTQSGCVRPR